MVAIFEVWISTDIEKRVAVRTEWGRKGHVQKIDSVGSGILSCEELQRALRRTLG